MSFNQPSTFVLSDQADLGHGPLRVVSSSAPVGRSHLVAPPALGPDLATNVRQLLARIEALEAQAVTHTAELTGLSSRLTDLTRPWGVRAWATCRSWWNAQQARRG